MSSAAYAVPFADINWQDNSTPASATHGDIYWSRGQGLAEKEQVFVVSGRLRERWQTLEQAHFTVAETGFGFGLNFLLTAAAWQAAKPRGAILNYVAFENSPVAPIDLSRLYGTLLTDEPAHLRQLADALVSQYPAPVSAGWHTLWVAPDICLILVVGDAAHCAADLVGEVDAWYLDGFSPAKNPDAWQLELFRNMAAHSRPGCTVTSYSVAGQVRRDLATAGFHVIKQPGFGHKAEMLFATWPGQWSPAYLANQRVAIIGAGIAGLNCARALRRRGHAVTLLESSDVALSGASNIPQLAIYPQLAVRPEVSGLHSLAAFGYAARDPGATPLGRCQLADTAADEERLQRIGGLLPDSFATFLAPDQIAGILGHDVGRAGLFFDGGAVVNPVDQFANEVHAVEVQRQVLDTHAGGIRFVDGSRASFDAVVIATGASQLDAARPLGLVPVRGQAISGTLTKPGPRAMIAGPVSIIPTENGVLIGATYAENDASIGVRPGDSDLLLAKFGRLLDASAFQLDRVHVGIRCTTRDRKPVVGPLPDWPALAEHCRDATTRPAFEDFVEGVYLLTGFGSHGATNAPLAAEDLARAITGEVSCIGRSWRARSSAARFALRDAGRKRELINRRSPSR